MSRVLLWDAGPGEVRAGIVEQGQLVELHILRPRRDGALLAAGEFYTTRVLRSLGQNKAQVTLGGPTEAILQPAKGFGEGTLLAAEMTRAPIPEPGRWKLPVVRPNASRAGISASSPARAFCASLHRVWTRYSAPMHRASTKSVPVSVRLDRRCKLIRWRLTKQTFPA